MSNKEKDSIQLLQGTLDLIVLRTLATMGPQHAYQIATRLQQISARLLNLNQGTLYPALIRLEQYGWIKGSWGRTESNREAKYYEITKPGETEMRNWLREILSEPVKEFPQFEAGLSLLPAPVRKRRTPGCSAEV